MGSQLPPEPAFQDGQARAAWRVVVHLRSHTGALALLPTEQSGRKAAGFEGRDVELTSPSGRARDGDVVVATLGRCSLPPPLLGGGGLSLEISLASIGLETTGMWCLQQLWELFDLFTDKSIEGQGGLDA